MSPELLLIVTLKKGYQLFRSRDRALIEKKRDEYRKQGYQTRLAIEVE